MSALAKPPSRLSRERRRVILALVLGFITTAALAWLAPIALYGVLPFRWYRSSCVVEGRIADLMWSRTALRDHTSVSPENTGFPASAPVSERPHWLTPPSAWNGAIRIDTDAAGFPFRAVSFEARYIHAPNQSNFTLQSLRGGVELSRTIDRLSILPLTPIWSGLTGNIACWSIVWWLALAGGAAIRSRRKGHCHKCRYDLCGLPTGSPCPECGTPQRTS